MKLSHDFSLYLVTQRNSKSLDETFKIILESIEGGVKVIQLREKEISAREMISIGKKLHSLLKPLKIPLIINDRVDVAYAIGAEGVHLGQSDLNVTDARAILGNHAIIGLSVETVEQAISAQNEEVDYIAASPVFCTQTKTDCNAPWGLNRLKQLCEVSNHPVIAIGGINSANIKDVVNCGVAGVAVVSAIFNSSSPKSAAKELLNLIKG